MSKNNRKKGHDLERQVTSDLKFSFPFARTSRAASKQLDNCKIDIAFTPILFQCKAGYTRNRPKYEEEFVEMKKQIALHYPQNDPIHKSPFVLVHKLDAGKGNRRREEMLQITTSYDFFMWLIENCEPLKSMPLVR